MSREECRAGSGCAPVRGGRLLARAELGKDLVVPEASIKLSRHSVKNLRLAGRAVRRRVRGRLRTRPK